MSIKRTKQTKRKSHRNSMCSLSVKRKVMRKSVCFLALSKANSGKQDTKNYGTGPR